MTNAAAEVKCLGTMRVTTATGSADPRLQGALCKTTAAGGGGEMKEWMKRICPCFSPSQIALVKSTREIVSIPVSSQIHVM